MIIDGFWLAVICTLFGRRFCGKVRRVARSLKLLIMRCIVLLLFLLPALVRADAVPYNQRYGLQTFLDNSETIQWDIAATVVGITTLGIVNWNWGNHSFRFNSEGWFGMDTGSGGTDKLGHAFSSYTLTNVFAERMIHKGIANDQAALTSFLISQSMMMYVEIFDGFSGDHGFSYEDVVLNTAGGALALLRQRYPAVKNHVDYRMEYWPSGYAGSGIKGFRPLSDYPGQKYLLAFKWADHPTPLRFFELQLGYYARGFTKEERQENKTKERTAFAGIGINLATLFFGAEKSTDGGYRKIGRTFFEHIEIPHTAVRAEKEIR